MNPFKVLGINEGATKKEAKKAYRKLSKKHHPDTPGGDTEKFKRLTKAYDMIKGGTDSQFFAQSDEKIFNAFYGKERTKEIKVNLVDVLNNKNIKIKINGKKIKFNLGQITDGKKIKVDNDYIKFKVETPDKFKINNKDILYIAHIDYIAAMKGTRIKIPNLREGEEDLIFEIPVNCKYGQVFKTKFKSIEDGHYFVKVKVLPPEKDLSSKLNQAGF